MASHQTEEIIFVLLPAVFGGLKKAGVRMAEVDAFGVARARLAQITDWSDHSKSLGEVYGRPSWRFSIGVARMASLGGTEYVRHGDARRGKYLVRCTAQGK